MKRLRAVNRKSRGSFTLSKVAFLSAVCGASSAHAQGEVLINQNKATTGNVTPGDVAGFPVTLTRAGSYSLSGNLTVPNANTSAIEITVEDVTVNLNGFSIVGPTQCSAVGAPASCRDTGTGIGVNASLHKNITVLNGTVRGMGSSGVSTGGSGAHVENMHVISNGGVGIVASGIVIDNTVNANGSTGISAVGVIRGNTSFGNAAGGISSSSGATVTGNNASANGTDGIFVVEGTVSGNTTNGNRDDGIQATSAAVTNNTVLDNSDFGLSLGATAGYAVNNVNDNKGSNTSPQVSGGINLGQNVCGGDTVCP